MPLYVYHCENGHTQEILYIRFEDSPKETACPMCKAGAVRVIGRPNFKLSWQPAVVDTAKEAWAGTPLEGTDGINRLQYKSKKIQIDLGTPKTQSGRKKKRRGMEAVLAGDAA